MTRQTWDYDYYVRLKGIDKTRAEEYKNQFRPAGVITQEPKEEIELETPVLTDEEIQQKNIETLNQAIEQKAEKRPEILLSTKEVKKELLKRWVKNANFLKDDQVMAKAKEIGL